MKKLLTLVSILLAVVLLAASCTTPGSGTTDSSTAKDTGTAAPAVLTQDDVDAAAEMVYTMNKPGENNIVANTFTLPAVLDYEDNKLSITWTVEGGDGLVSIETAEGSEVAVIKVNKYADADTEFTVKGVVTSGELTAARVVTFTYVIKEYSIATWTYWAENTKDVNMNVKGVIVAKYPYSTENKNTGVFLQDLDGEHGYFAYRMKCDSQEAYDTDLAIGNVIVVNGKTSLYNGWREMGAGCTYEVVKNEDGSVQTGSVVKIAIDEKIAADENLDPYQDLIVTLTGFKVKAIDWNTNNAETYEEKGAGSVYITLTKDGKDFKLYYSTSNQFTLEQLKAEYEKLAIGYTVNVEGPLAWYNTPQIYPCVGGVTVTSTEVSAEDKIEEAISKVSLVTSVDEQTEIVLPTPAAYETEITYAWSVPEGSTIAAITDGKLILTPGDETADVVVTLTATCGDATKTKEFTISVVVGEPTYEDIVKAAYALEKGKNLGTQRLFGKITTIDTAYSEQYGNITVTIQIGDLADKPIQCFRMKGDGIADLKVDDEITVEGLLKNHNGTIEFDAGCQLIGMGEILDPAKIVRQAYALAAGATMENVTLTGVITTIDTAYSAQYGNITVTIQIGDLADKPIQCYRLKGAEGVDISGLAVGDTITVTGTIKNFVKNNVSTIEFDTGCTVSEIVKAVAPKTQEEIVADAYALEAGATMENVTLTGVITTIDTAYSAQYGNITVTIQIGDLADKPIQCYRLKGAEGVDISGLAVGDAITVTGTIKNFVKNEVSTIEFDTGCTVSEIVKATPAES